MSAVEPTFDLGARVLALAEVEPELDLARVGGSDVGAILGLSPWGGPWDVWVRTVFGTSSFAGNDATRWGRRLEPVILAAWAADAGVDVEQPPSLLVGEHLRATPDAVALRGQLVIDCKATSHAPWEDLPVQYQAQLAFVAHHWQADRAVVAALHRGNDLRSYEVDLEGAEAVAGAIDLWVQRHVAPAKLARAAGRDPWEFRPAPDASQSYTQAVASRWQTLGERRPATEVESELVAELAALEAEIAALEAKRGAARALLLDSIGEAAGLDLVDGRRVLAPRVAGRKSTAWASVVRELRATVPGDLIDELVERHTRLGEASRQLRLPKEE